MRPPAILGLLAFLQLTTAKPKNAILLSEVQSLTLRAGKMTSHRRVAAVPQLSCTANPPAICDLHPIDVMRCTNQGAGYDDQDIQWSCTAPLPPELKLGATEVVCEGYASRDDPYVLRGSCAVEYRLLLTDHGEQRFPDLAHGGAWSASDASSALFYLVFVGVVVWILWSAWAAATPRGGQPGGAGGRRPWFGGGGGGGPGFGGGPGGPGGRWDSPPPPYPGTKPEDTATSQNWRPGFWSGLAGGAAAGYFAGRNNNSSRRDDMYNRRRGWDGRDDAGWDAGVGPSRPTRSSSSRTTSSSRYQSTGFGSTSRR